MYNLVETAGVLQNCFLACAFKSFHNSFCWLLPTWWHSVTLIEFIVVREIFFKEAPCVPNPVMIRILHMSEHVCFPEKATILCRPYLQWCLCEEISSGRPDSFHMGAVCRFYSQLGAYCSQLSSPLNLFKRLISENQSRKFKLLTLKKMKKWKVHFVAI